MTTLIAVYNSEGCVGRCDAKCYAAKPGSPCDCICGGANHAAGRAKAEANTRAWIDHWLEEYAAAHPELGPLRTEAQLALPLGGGGDAEHFPGNTLPLKGD